MVAQGNALGKMIQKCVLVLKGQHKRAPLFCPFRANALAIMYPGRCPGLRLSLRFQRDETVALHFFSGAAFSKASNFVRLFRVSVS